MYTPYVDIDYYKNMYEGTVIPDDEISKYLKQSSRQIDTLTFNRIIGRGFTNLTEFQKDLIQDVVCQHADFICENQDTITSIISGYSINGVSMSLKDSCNINTSSGVIIRNDIMALLNQTGLTCRILR